MSQNRTVRFLVVSGDQRVNEFMKAADLRGDSKVFAKMRTVILTGTAANEEMFEQLKTALQKEYWLVYLLCEQQPELVYRDEEVKVVSNGRNFFMLDDYLEMKGYPQCQTV